MSIPTLAVELTAGELVRSIIAGDLSAREVVDAHIDRIEQVDDRLNAVVVRRFDAARREADAVDAARGRGEELGSLAGVPVTITDQFHVAGLPTSFGVSRLADHRATEDGEVVAALREAGAIVVGKTNVPQGLAAIETDNDLFGRTNNPWDLDRTPGGSSGGDAAIVAAGGATVGLGADDGGGLRIPAAWCGLYTLKPTARRLPIDHAPVRGRVGTVEAVAQAGLQGRTTADLALVLPVVADALAALPTGNHPPVALPDPSRVDLSSMRIAVLGEVDGFACSPAIRRALDEAAGALRASGATVEAWEPGPDTATGVELAVQLATAGGLRWIRDLIGADRPQPQVKADLRLVSLPNPVIRATGVALRAVGQHRAARLRRHIRTRSAADLLDVVGDRLEYEATFLAALDAGGYDAVLCPATPVPAPRHGAARHIPDVGSPAGLFSLLGMPAGIVPVTRVRAGEESDRPASRDRAVAAARFVERGSAGLPVGVQIAARHWCEDVVLAAMAAVETHAVVHPDYPERPPL